MALTALILTSPTWPATAAPFPPTTLAAARTTPSAGPISTYAWHTFHGSSTIDESYDAAVDSSGNIYVTGYSSATWTGPLGEAPIHAYSGGDELWVLKLDTNGAYLWHTFYGSSGPAAGADYGFAIAVDEGGGVYVSGCSDATWQGDGGTDPLHARTGFAQDLLVLKLDSNGAYQWHTFYGGGSTDVGNGIAVRGSTITVGAETYGTWLGDGDAAPLHAGSGGHDMLVLRLDTDGAYGWHTFWGGGDMSGAEKGYAIALDGDGNITVGGESYSTWLGESSAEPLHAYSGSYDWTVLKLDAAGAYEWHTFYGTSASDCAWDVAVDTSGTIYIAGMSAGGWQGDGDTDPLHAASGSFEATLFGLSSSGTYQWHTFYGSSLQDEARAVAVDGSGNVHVAGTSWKTWLGDGDTAPVHAFNADKDSVVVKLELVGSHLVFIPLVMRDQ